MDSSAVFGTCETAPSRRLREIPRIPPPGIPHVLCVLGFAVFGFRSRCRIRNQHDKCRGIGRWGSPGSQDASMFRLNL
eukprot:6882755-Alexandrium_andersonii.AAC.1